MSILYGVPGAASRTPALLALAIVAAACGGPSGEAEAREATVRQQGDVDVVVRAVRRLARPTYVSVSGEVEGRRTVNVGFQVAGVVATVPVDEGDAVDAGGVLAELDQEPYRLGLQAAEATADLARDALKRSRQLETGNTIPPADFVKVEVGVRQAEAQEGLARKQLRDTRLVSPIDGIVARRGVQPGEQVGPGHPVFTIVQVNQVQVRVGVPEAEIGRIRTGQTATVSIPALAGESFEGRVRVVGIAADPVSRTYVVRLNVANPERVLRPGMIAEVRIQDGGRINALTLPGESIVRDAAGAPFVYVYDKSDGRVRTRSVTVGSVLGREVEITSGLTGTEQVVVGGQHRLRAGAVVNARVVALADSVRGS